MSADNQEIARRENGTIEVRIPSLPMRWKLQDLVTSDSHRMGGTFSCFARILDTPTERRMLAETFLATREAVTIQDVVEHFRPAIQTSASKSSQSKPIEQWLRDEHRAEMATSLRDVANALAFTCGIELIPPFVISLTSPTLDRQKMEEVQRAAVERRSAGQVEHLKRATEVMQQFQSLRAAAPKLSPGELLRQISPADQGELLGSLLLAGSGRPPTECVAVVAGPNLVCVDPRTTLPSTRVITLPQELGPLRSVAICEGGGELLVGARHGIMLTDSFEPIKAELYRDNAELGSPHGFSRLVRSGSGIWASHRDGGLVGWEPGDHDTPKTILRPTQVGGIVRNLCESEYGPRLLFTVDTRLASFDGRGRVELYDDFGVEVIALLPAGDRLIAVTQDGRVRMLESSTFELLHESRPLDEISAAASIPWLGNTRLLLAPARGAVICMGLEDPVITQYASPHHAIPMLAAAEDIVVGVSSDRQRLILWHSWDGRAPFAEVHIAALAKHRVAGIAV